jgi:hypothetical protein
VKQSLDHHDCIEDGMFKITHQQIKTYIFDPIVNQILKLIDEQLIKTQAIIPDSLFLVGHFRKKIICIRG